MTSTTRFIPRQKRGQTTNSAIDLATCESCGRRGKERGVLLCTRVNERLVMEFRRLCRRCKASEPGWHHHDFERRGDLNCLREAA